MAHEVDLVLFEELKSKDPRARADDFVDPLAVV
eukprot:CAMPEP_0168351360 /NCGR_PEP_ID=MMETSP0213-20121227/21810_1 /TAXON_ID=151035 /ORGANISM="Euplotes harpa, Strain FSP1.4" /LENGTH=32 /DNA_ID= /DNA_START= /DNA_END= /DNA_ORIENTATION=